MIYALLFLAAIVVFLVIKVFPILNGYAAKIVCSGVFVSGRLPHEVIASDINSFPFNLCRCTVDLQQQQTVATVAGVATKKAIFTEGFGATLLPVKDFFGYSVSGFHKEAVASSHQLPRQLSAHPMLLKAVAEAFYEPAGHVRKTRALLVLHRGTIIAEQYAQGFSASTKFPGWSMAKSITGALVGILVKQRKLHLHAPVPIEPWQHDERKSISLHHLLTMSSGLRWWEYYAAPSDVTNMLYNQPDMGQFAINKPLQYLPGSNFKYSSGTTNILSHIIRQSVDPGEYHQFPYRQLLHKAGMYNTLLETDATGTFVGSSYCYATAHDWARFGLLYLNNGCFEGEEILPDTWIKYTRTPTTANAKVDEAKYGAHWWLNSPKTSNAANRKYPNVPEDCFWCQGYEGQYIWVIPSQQLVVVRLAHEKNNSLDPNILLPMLLAGLG